MKPAERMGSMSVFSRDALEEAKAEAKAEKATLKAHTVLIVDDEPNNLTALSNLLQDEYNILTARDGREALQLVQTDDHPERIHLIISDQRMPHLSGVDFLKKTAELIPGTVRILLTAYSDVNDIIASINKAQIYQYILKPFDNQELMLTIKRALDSYELDQKNVALTKSLREANVALQEAIRNLHVTKITTGVYWLQIPEADLYILCGCPADVVKHMMSRGFISTTSKNGVTYETGPNAILLSEVLIQNGMFSNLAEFPILQMLFRQGMILPGHPNNTGTRPMLIGSEEQVNAQMEYIFRGSNGLTTREELLETGVSEEFATEILGMKKKFDFGDISRPEEFLDSRIIEDQSVEIKNGVYARRAGFNQYEFHYRGNSAFIDLNLKTHDAYDPPYKLGYHEVEREYFAVIHSGEGDGWDVHRPCMASILMFQGKIYLIDAGPTILHTLRALSIDTSEIEGIFHSHAHDDHFAGLPILMHSDHRIKYYATPLVRASIAKKLSALMSIKEDIFYTYFDVHDLEFDTWNEIDGLEVKPLLSPHPVENNIFIFRALGEDGYKTYAHWADISAFDVLENMVEEDNAGEGLSKNFYETIKANYQIPADLKKVDVGGGFIHGKVDDFRKDQSKKIILAHTASELTIDQKEVGSETSFGTVDVLISTDQNYLRKQASEYLQDYYPDVSREQQRVVLNSPIVMFNPGSIIQKKGANPESVFLILSGSAEFLQPEFQIQNTLSSGCFIGDVAIIRNTACNATWRAISHVRTLCMPAGLYRSFIDKNKLYDQMKNIIENIEFLQKTFILGEGISYPVQNKIARVMQPQKFNEKELLPAGESPGLYLLKEGELRITNREGMVVEELFNGNFFGEESLLSGEPSELYVQVKKPSIVNLIKDYPLLDIPIVHWKLLEISTKRKKIVDGLNFFAADIESV